MQLRWGSVVFAMLALCAGWIWWTQPAVVHRILQSHPEGVASPPETRADRGPTLYRWVDSGGVVNISTDKPPRGFRYTIVHVDPNRNIVPLSDASSTARAATKAR